jgi:hypothetical protein
VLDARAEAKRLSHEAIEELAVLAYRLTETGRAECPLGEANPSVPQAGYLPYEGDRMLAVILSKAMLLAKDTGITDPTVLSQL